MLGDAAPKSKDEAETWKAYIKQLREARTTKETSHNAHAACKRATHTVVAVAAQSPHGPWGAPKSIWWWLHALRSHALAGSPGIG